jgi:hypothetical protein
MAVARSYINCEIVSEPYTQDGRNYVNIKTRSGVQRRVRWYSNEEYYKMYGEVYAPKPHLTEKEKLGFSSGFITIFKGSTYPHKDWLKENGARFNKIFNWSFAGDVEIPADLPEDLEPLQIPWEAVSTNDKLNSETEIRAYLDSLLYEPSNSEYVGEIGEKITDTFTVTRAIVLNGYYGMSIMHILEDANGNVYIWNTTARNYPEGKVVTLCGTVKDHREYKGTKQTILTRCKEI